MEQTLHFAFEIDLKSTGFQRGTGFRNSGDGGNNFFRCKKVGLNRPGGPKTSKTQDCKLAEYPEVTAGCCDFKFKGRGQRDTLVLSPRPNIFIDFSGHFQTAPFRSGRYFGPLPPSCSQSGYRFQEFWGRRKPSPAKGLNANSAA